MNRKFSELARQSNYIVGMIDSASGQGKRDPRRESDGTGVVGATLKRLPISRFSRSNTHTGRSWRELKEYEQKKKEKKKLRSTPTPNGGGWEIRGWVFFVVSCHVVLRGAPEPEPNRTWHRALQSRLVSSVIETSGRLQMTYQYVHSIRPVHSQYKLVLNVTRVNLLPNCCLFAACCSLGAVPSARRTSTAMAAGAGLTPSILSNLHYSRLFVHTGSECELASSATGRRLSAAP